MTVSSALSWASIVLAGVAAVLAIKTATISVRNNVDVFIDDISRQGRWATWTALASAAAVAAQAMEKLLSN